MTVSVRCSRCHIQGLTNAEPVAPIFLQIFKNNGTEDLFHPSLWIWSQAVQPD